MLNYGNDSAINGRQRHSSSACWHIAAVGCAARAEDAVRRAACVRVCVFSEKKEVP